MFPLPLDSASWQSHRLFLGAPVSVNPDNHCLYLLEIPPKANFKYTITLWIKSDNSKTFFKFAQNRLNHFHVIWLLISRPWFNIIYGDCWEVKRKKLPLRWPICEENVCFGASIEVLQIRTLHRRQAHVLSGSWPSLIENLNFGLWQIWAWSKYVTLEMFSFIKETKIFWGKGITGSTYLFYNYSKNVLTEKFDFKAHSWNLWHCFNCKICSDELIRLVNHLHCDMSYHYFPLAL